MKIKCYLCRSAPELCYFTLNGIRYREQPMLGKQVDWYNTMYSNRAMNPIATIRAKHFRRCKTRKIAKITITYDDIRPPKIEGGVFLEYSEVLEYVKTLKRLREYAPHVTVETFTLTGSL
jgi:hypothetical protein